MMQPLMNEQKQKYLSTLITSGVAFLGFEALSYIVGIYQLKTAVLVSLYVYAFHIFWLTFLFDLHLKKRGVWAEVKVSFQGIELFFEAFKRRVEHVRKWEYLRHYQNYLVLPGIIYWSTVALMFLNPFQNEFKQLLVITASFCMSVAYWFMKEHVSRKLEAHDSWIKVLSLVKLFAAFLIYSAIIGIATRFGYDAYFLLYSIFVVTFLLVYQALFQHKLLTFQIFLWIIIIALILGIVSVLVYSNWNTEYFTAGLVLLAVYNCLWGILHHHLDRTLSRRLVFEYVVMMLFVVSFLLASHNFDQRVG